MIKLSRKAYVFWRLHGTMALIRRVRDRAIGNIQQPAGPFSVLPRQPAKSVAQLTQARFGALTPLPTYQLPPSAHRQVSLVTDSIGTGSLFGGVGTALIFATLLANKLGADLRIITRTERPQPDNVDHLLRVYGLELQGEIQFKFLPPSDLSQSIDFLETELFITTSWWTTAATLAGIPARLIIYLLQEDERMFYPFGDDRLRCETILRNRDIRFVINSRLLFDHLVSAGLPHLQERGWWFEPAFPAQVFHPRMAGKNSKRKFIFYARPNNLRNLFYLGIEVIEAAIEQRILDPEEWEIILAGKDIPDIVFGDGRVPAKHENLSWSDYAELAGSIDLGLCLMYTPHPSYPPLDLVASGAVVVTNRFANKQDLNHYSPNLICADLERDALVVAIRQGVALAMDPLAREENSQNHGLCTDWNRSLAEILQHLSGTP